jgi:hypothetical protein
MPLAATPEAETATPISSSPGTQPAAVWKNASPFSSTVVVKTLSSPSSTTDTRTSVDGSRPKPVTVRQAELGGTCGSRTHD